MDIGVKAWRVVDPDEVRTELQRLVDGGMSQTDIAKKAGSSKSRVSEIMSGKRPANKSVLAMLGLERMIVGIVDTAAMDAPGSDPLCWVKPPQLSDDDWEVCRPTNPHISRIPGWIPVYRIAAAQERADRMITQHHDGYYRVVRISTGETLFMSWSHEEATAWPTSPAQPGEGET